MRKEKRSTHHSPETGDQIHGTEKNSERGSAIVDGGKRNDRRDETNMRIVPRAVILLRTSLVWLLAEFMRTEIAAR